MFLNCYSAINMFKCLLHSPPRTRSIWYLIYCTKWALLINRMLHVCWISNEFATSSSLCTRECVLLHYSRRSNKLNSSHSRFGFANSSALATVDSSLHQKTLIHKWINKRARRHFHCSIWCGTFLQQLSRSTSILFFQCLRLLLYEQSSGAKRLHRRY